MENLKKEIIEILIKHSSEIFDETKIFSGSYSDISNKITVLDRKREAAANEIVSLFQAITDPENQPNQYGIIL